jgi:hypothetical protein
LWLVACGLWLVAISLDALVRVDRLKCNNGSSDRGRILCVADFLRLFQQQRSPMLFK